MKRSIVSGILGITILGLMSVSVATAIWPDHATAAGMHGLYSGSGGHHAGGRGWHHAGGAGGSHCGHLDSKHTRLLQAYIDISLELTDDQTIALEPVIEVVNDWQNNTRTLCESMQHSTASAALGDLEAVLGATQSAVSRLRPAFDDFYAQLTPAQQLTVDGWVAHRQATPES